MARDLVHELIRRNAELTAQVSDLTRALAQGEAVSQLVAGVVHDFRNALHVMLLEAEALTATLEDPSQLESAEQVLAAGNHAAAIARDLLAVSRKEQACTSLVNSAELLARFQRLIQRLVLKRLECVFETDPDAWSVEVERQQLEAALINLTVNARDAMPHGGLLRISAHNLPRGAALPSELPPGDYVGFAVEDTGIGMSKLVLARATEAFFTTKEAASGTGLGLSMVQAFARRSGGALTIQSEPDRGTRVQILLPRAAPASAAMDLPSQQTKLERLQRRIRSEWLQGVLESWSAACPHDGLPQPAAAEATVIDHADCSVVLGVEPGATPPALRLLWLGDSLVHALEGTALGELPLHGSLVLGSLGAAYRRAFCSRFPSYEYVHYTFGEGSPAEFERLILPAATDGKTVSHLIGVIALPGFSQSSIEHHVEQ